MDKLIWPVFGIGEQIKIVVDDPNQLRDPIGYICPKCQAKLYGSYQPFCGACGRPMAAESRMQAVGLTIYPIRYGRAVRNVLQINSILRDLGVQQYWLEEYYPTFRTTKIRVRTIRQFDSDYEIICTSTLRIELPVGNGWSGIMEIREIDDGTLCLIDDNNKIRVTAGAVSLHCVLCR